MRVRRLLRVIRVDAIALGASFIVMAGTATASPLLVENFDNVAALSGSGWARVNNSQPVGMTGWFQGNGGVFAAQSGAPDAYVAANFNGAAAGGNLSEWLISPTLTFDSGDTISFYTRTEVASIFPDRLEVRLSTNGASTNVGATDSSVGDFTTLLLTINPLLDLNGYPDAWTSFTVALAGLGASTSGRFAFRYAVTDTDINADYIGIDSVVVNTPEPCTLALIGAGILAARARHRRTSHPARS